MKRYRVTLTQANGLGTRMASTNVPAESLTDAVRRAAHRLTGHPACNLLPTAETVVDGCAVRVQGRVLLYASTPDYWAGDVAETWAYEAQHEPMGEAFSLLGLVRLGQIAGPITPRRGGEDACAA